MSAVFSGCGQYRYSLTRGWGEAKHPALCWILLNPSTADATNDDPTIRRCIGYAKAWGYDFMYVVNLFAFRATSPKDMKAATDPVGPDCDRWIWDAVSGSNKVIAGWGQHGTHRGRSGEVRQMLMSAGVPLYCLKRAKDGQPMHPLYLPANLEPQLLDAPVAAAATQEGDTDGS